MNDQIEQLEDRDRALADDADCITEQLKHIDGLAGPTKTFAVGLSKGKSTIESQSAFIDFFSKKRMLAQGDLRKNVIERRELGREMSKLRKELKSLQNTRPDERYTALTDVEIHRAGYLDVELVYHISGARWKPIYDIRLVKSELELSCLGEVSQLSGEDWPGVNLSLSTIPPAPATIAPELDPWYVCPAVYSSRGPVAVTADAPIAGALFDEDAVLEAADMLEELESEIQEAEYASAEVSQSGVSVTFRIPDPVHIPGDGSSHKPMISHLQITPQINDVAVPKIEARAYRRVIVDNDSNLRRTVSRFPGITPPTHGIGYLD